MKNNLLEDLQKKVAKEIKVYKMYTSPSDVFENWYFIDEKNQFSNIEKMKKQLILLFNENQTLINSLPNAVTVQNLSNISAYVSFFYAKYSPVIDEFELFAKLHGLAENHTTLTLHVSKNSFTDFSNFPTIQLPSILENYNNKAKLAIS